MPPPPQAKGFLSTARLRAFHADSAPDGHGPTRTSSWLSAVVSRPAEVADTLDAHFALGYEPYGIVKAARLRQVPTRSGAAVGTCARGQTAARGRWLAVVGWLRGGVAARIVDRSCVCARSQVGSYDERLFGWHRDRAEFFARLAAGLPPSPTHVGVGPLSFSVLCSPAAFLLDHAPHAPTAQRSASRLDPLYVAAMEGLFQRSLRVVRARGPDASEASPRDGAAAVDRADRGEEAAGAADMLARRYGAAVVRLRGFGGATGAGDSDAEGGSTEGSSANGWWGGGYVDDDVRGCVSAWPGPWPSSAARGSVWGEDEDWEVIGHTGLANVAFDGQLATVALAAGGGPPSACRAAGLPVSGVAVRASPTSVDVAAGGIAIQFAVRFDGVPGVPDCLDGLMHGLMALIT